MSLKTRIHGFTAWVNLRLKPFDQLMNNVIMELLSGSNLKNLLMSLTGTELKRVDSFDGLSDDQKRTRVEWIVAELKRCKVIPEDIIVDYKMLAMNSADHIFKLLWRLVCHDVWFVWERAEFLQQDDGEKLTDVVFTWIPKAPPVKKKAQLKTTTSLLSGFGSSSVITTKVEDKPDPVPHYDPFPGSEVMKSLGRTGRHPARYPPPDVCILSIVQRQLTTSQEGRNLNVKSIDDLADSRVLCALVNSFVPNVFASDAFMNDRWTINTVLRTIGQMFHMSSPFDAADLVEGDAESLCAYLCAFFMLAFQYRQAGAAVRRRDQLHQACRVRLLELRQIPEAPTDTTLLQRRAQLKCDTDNIERGLKTLESSFDMDSCQRWVRHVKDVVKSTHKCIQQKIKDRFDVIPIPRNVSIKDFCLSQAINLSLTDGAGFYKAEGRETLSEHRKVVIRTRNTSDFVDNFTRKNTEVVRKLLGLPARDVAEIDAEAHAPLEIFVESLSRNKVLRPGAVFLYQVFPGKPHTWQQILFRAVRDNQHDTVQRLCAFFTLIPAVINAREAQTGNSPLHVACRMGLCDIVQTLLESGANIDQQNNAKQTPLFSACEGIHQDVAKLLIEWGCDVHARGPRGKVALEVIKNDEFRDSLIESYEYYSNAVPLVMAGDMELLKQMIDDHVTGRRPFSNLRSRCINGTTLLHTAAYFACIPIIEDLMSLGLDLELRDYKGATPLHRASGVDTIQALLALGPVAASPNAEDDEANTPLHVKCYGQVGVPSEVEAIQLLVDAGAKVTARNCRGLMPIHCSAMQGRLDVVKLLLAADGDSDIMRELQAETGNRPPSVVHLALANDCLEAADWFLNEGFHFKIGEQDALLLQIVSEQMEIEKRREAVRFLLKHGATPNPCYPGGNSALHYAASTRGPADVVEEVLGSGSDVDAVNGDGSSPLFYACQCNNHHVASALLAHGANFRLKNLHGLTAFDYIVDYEDWIEGGVFNAEIRARLKAYSLKHARNLIRAISQKVKACDHGPRSVQTDSAVSRDPLSAMPGSERPAPRPAPRPALRHAPLHGDRMANTFALSPLDGSQVALTY